MSFTASCAAAMMALPTYMPIDPPMNEKSCAAATIGVRPISPVATSIASFSPVFFCAAFMRSGIFLLIAEMQRVIIGGGNRYLGKDTAVKQSGQTGRAA